MRPAAFCCLVFFTPLSQLESSCHDRDEDGDGVISCDDKCPSTPPGEPVDRDGCSCLDIDDDMDGIPNCGDQCPGHDDTEDTDGDGIIDCLDLCPRAFQGSIGSNGCPPSSTHWESPHVHPLEAEASSGSRILAVNTSDHRLEVFRPTVTSLAHEGSVPVGLEPVSVRSPEPGTAWVVNRISGSISIVDLDTLSVTATVSTGAEPADVVYAGVPRRAFVSVSGRDTIEVYSPSAPMEPPVVLPLEGRHPRALVTDGKTVFVGFFLSGNASTVLPREAVSLAEGPYGGTNPPPNRGDSFHPALDPQNPDPPPTSLVVQRDAEGRWLDDNDSDWSAKVTWNVHDHDVALVDADTLEVSYVSGLMNAVAALDLLPDGRLSVVGTDATNGVRFEPNLNGVFHRVSLAFVSREAGSPPTRLDLNPHLDYGAPSAPPTLRFRSLGDPRCVTWSRGLSRGFITGMGSGNLLELDSSGSIVRQVSVGSGPTGIVADQAGSRLYILRKFDASIAVLDLHDLEEQAVVSFFDPTPPDVQAGRRRFYDTHASSGLGHASCASCHLDARNDGLAWDLGDPAGGMKAFNQECTGDQHPCVDWHPMKGPMLTQDLAGAMGSEPFHWRGDREGLFAFNQAFRTLLGAENILDDAGLEELRTFLASISLPPNPNRDMNDGTSPSPMGGDPESGEALFHSRQVQCVSCHSSPDGSRDRIVAPDLLNESQGINVPQLSRLFSRGGFHRQEARNASGFGFGHDGAFSSLLEMLEEGGIDHSGREPVRFQSLPGGDRMMLDLASFLPAFPTGLHPAVGKQLTIAMPPDSGQSTFVSSVTGLGDVGKVGLVARARRAGVPRGFAYAGNGVFQSDRAFDLITVEDLLAGAGPGAEVTLTVVPPGMEGRLGIDRDRDGYLDGDEVDACSDPADPARGLTGLNNCSGEIIFRRGDSDGDGSVNISDPILTLSYLFSGSADPGCPRSLDADDSGRIDVTDPIIVLGYLFLGTSGPAEPFSTCGFDRTSDPLSCDDFPACGNLGQIGANSVGMRFTFIPAGSFSMGSPRSEPGRQLDGGIEGPEHRVTITEPFYMGITEVTRKQFADIMGQPPGVILECPECPAEQVSWFEAEEFCHRLSHREERTYRLPTEAEWEYAARAGTTTRFYFGDAASCGTACDPCSELDEHAWWCGNSSRTVHPVARKSPNPWGLHDVYGNAEEWCSDWYGPYEARTVSNPKGPSSGSTRVTRGGGAASPLHACRSAHRAECCTPGVKAAGFRVVLSTAAQEHGS